MKKVMVLLIIAIIVTLGCTKPNQQPIPHDNSTNPAIPANPTFPTNPTAPENPINTTVPPFPANPTGTNTTPGTGTTPSLKFGSYFSPPNFPVSTLYLTKGDVDIYFARAREVGRSVAVFVRWDDTSDAAENWKQIRDRAVAEGLEFQFYLDPLVGASHNGPAPPSTVAGTSFADPDVRAAFKAKILELAAVSPRILSMGSEVNMMFTSNAQEFASFATLVKETYDAVKAQYPNQQLTVSFQLEDLKKQDARSVLDAFKGGIDIYTFTTYPNADGTHVNAVPSTYFSWIRTYLPTERVAISEIAWYSGIGTEADQAEFYQKLPDLVRALNPEYITQFWLFDLPSNLAPPLDAIPQQFRTGGLVHNDNTIKPAFTIAKNY